MRYVIEIETDVSDSLVDTHVASLVETLSAELRTYRCAVVDRPSIVEDWAATARVLNTYTARGGS